jgi:hypothetical protein
MEPLTISPEGYQYLLIFIDCIQDLSSREINICFSTRNHNETCMPSENPNRSRYLTNFTSQLFKVYIQYKIRQILSSAYHHQTIGKIERFRKFMENALSTIIRKDQNDWP